jgi:hypothetical protein
MHRHLTGQLYRRTELVLQVQIGGRAPNASFRLLSGLKRRKVKRGLNSDKVPQLLGGRRLALQ